MNSFVKNVKNQKTTTKNGMKARISSASSNVDLFYKIGASRGQNIIPEFTAAFVENPDLAIRILLNARDIREGKGERKIFRDILNHIEYNYPELLERIVNKIPELGRWDDGFCLETNKGKNIFYSMIAKEIENDPNSLVFKWLPREKSAKKQKANELMHFLGMKPKQYRKMLVKNTNVVEQDMCANKWDDINFSHVPSCAMHQYKRAFPKHTSNFVKYLEDLKNNVKGVKINAGAIFPHTVLKDAIEARGYSSSSDQDVMIQQWNALPDYMNGSRILPMVDVSGSMNDSIPNSNYSCMTVAVSLGLYCADKNKGSYKDLFLTFSSEPELLLLKGDISQKIHQMIKSRWKMSTNLAAAFDLILEHGLAFNVPEDEMPEMVLIFSDMQFNASYYEGHSQTAFKMIKTKYKDAGYKMPKVVYWNLNSYNNVPVKFDKEGTAMVSGFSPSILKSILSAEDFSPEGIMLKEIMKERYNW